jgi:ABC-type transport system substrate-binding protein
VNLIKKWKKKKENKKKDQVVDHDFLDKKLVYSLSSHKIPSVKQVKYLKKVLNPKERIVLSISFFVIFIALIFFAFNYYKKNLEILPKEGGSYTEAILGSPKNINPLYDIIRDADKDMSRLVYSSLFKRDGDGVLTQDLVEEYLVSEDGKEYTFKIKEGVLWHHGEVLTADDIVFTFNAISNPEYGSPIRSSFVGVSIEKVDDYNFKFKLEEPYAAFLDLLTFGIISQNLWSTISPQNASLAEFNLKPIGTGPYKFETLTKNKAGEIKEMTFVVNENYYGNKPYITSIKFKFYTYVNELIGALNDNQVDGISYLPYNMKDDLISQNSLNFRQLSLPQISSIFFNQKSDKAISDKDVRKALALSIDREEMINDIFSGNAGIAYGPILPTNFAYNEEIEKYNYNFEEAGKILEELDWLEVEISEEDFLSIEELVTLENNKIEKITTTTEDGSDEVVVENEAEFLEYSDKLSKATERVDSINDWQLKKSIVEEYFAYNSDIIGKWKYKKSESSDRVYDYLSVKLTTVDLTDNIDVANYIKKSWEELGVRTFVEILDTVQVQSKIINNKNFEIALLSQVVGTDPDSYMFWHSSQSGDNGLNISSYRDKDVDLLLEEARISMDVEERAEKYKEFQKILNEDLPAFFLYFPNYTYVQNKMIKGFDTVAISDPADRFNNISNWYIKIKRRINF